MKESRMKGRRMGRMARFAAMLFLAMGLAVPVSAATHSTTYNGVNYKKVYSYKYYTTKVHPELAGKSDATVLEYFVKNGIPNGEQAVSSFSVKSYRNANSDLRLAFGNNYVSYVNHYLTKGYQENRKTTGYDNKLRDPINSYDGQSYSHVYDFNYYMSKYPSLKKKYALDDVGAIKYFINKGMAKKHQANADFNVTWYYNATPTMRYLCGQTWSRYYLYYQKKAYTKGPIKKCTTLQNPITYYKVGGKKISLATIYDFEYFTKNNTTAYKYWTNQDDAGAIKYFVKTGLLAGLKGNAKYSKSSSAYKAIKKEIFPTMTDNELALADTLKSSTEYLLLVNQGKHMVYVFQGKQYNWKKIGEFPCVVGKPSTPTGVGEFRVFLKRYYFTTNNDSAKCWYFTVFNGDEGFHSQVYDMSDTPVNIVDPSMGVSVSHGCVRVSLSNAKWIYDTIPLKTKVKVYNRPW